MGFLDKLFGKKEEPKMELAAPLAGEAVSISQVNDPTFSDEILGKGLAIRPTGNEVFAPCDGKIEMMFDTGHAVSMTSNDGIEILIHVGLETVNLKGKYYQVHAANGDQVKKGQKLISFDREAIAAEGDVTKLIEFTKSSGLKFYPSMIWIVSKVVNAHDEFKYSWDKDGSLIKWDFISPSYTDFHKEDENFTKLVTVFSDDLFEFHNRFMVDKEQNKYKRAFVENQPSNFFDVSCLPWIKYKHFDVHVFDEGVFLAPVITWGKYEMEQGKYLMPLTMNIHHAVADGFHLSRFFIEVQELINSLPYKKNKAL